MVTLGKSLHIDSWSTPCSPQYFINLHPFISKVVRVYLLFDSNRASNEASVIATRPNMERRSSFSNLLTPSTMPLSVKATHQVRFRYVNFLNYKLISTRDSSDKNLHPQKSRYTKFSYGDFANSINPPSSIIAFAYRLNTSNCINSAFATASIPFSVNFGILVKSNLTMFLQLSTNTWIEVSDKYLHPLKFICVSSLQFYPSFLMQKSLILQFQYNSILFKNLHC